MTVPSEAAGKAKLGGKITLTASGGGIFPIPPIPQYTATKHAIIGLVRALAIGKSAKANVRINAVCPAIVDTGALPLGLMDKLPPDQVTPMSTIIRCFDTLADFGDVVHEDWVERGRTGETVEGNVQELIWHYAPERPQGKGGKFDRKNMILLVGEAYEEKKRQFLATGQ